MDEHGSAVSKKPMELEYVAKKNNDNNKKWKGVMAIRL